MLISTSTPSYSTASLLSSQVSSDPDRRLKISPFCLSRSNDFAELDRAGSMPRPAAAVPAPRLSTNLNSYTASRFVIEPSQPLTDLALVTQVSVATPSLFFPPARPTSGFYVKLCRPVPPVSRLFVCVSEGTGAKEVITARSLRLASGQSK